MSATYPTSLIYLALGVILMLLGLVAHRSAQGMLAHLPASVDDFPHGHLETDDLTGVVMKVK